MSYGCGDSGDDHGYCSHPYDDDDFTKSDMCCLCGGGATLATPTPAPTPAPSPAVCEDTDNGVFDNGGYDCTSSYGSNEYCNNYDDSDFSSGDMCCICGGGGFEQAPTVTFVVSLQYTADETLPSSVQESDLMSSTVYKDAKTTGLSAALSVPVSDITITGFTLGGRRLSTALRRLVDTVTVTTNFLIEASGQSVADELAATIAGAAEAIQNETDSAMADADWSGEAVITTPPTMTTPDVANPEVLDPTPAPTPSPTFTPTSSRTFTPTSSPTPGPTPASTSDGKCRWTSWGEFWFNSKLAAEHGARDAFVLGTFADPISVGSAGEAVTCDQQAKVGEWNIAETYFRSNDIVVCPPDVPADEVPCVAEAAAPPVETESGYAYAAVPHAILGTIALLACNAILS